MGEVEKLKIFLEAENTHFQESIKKRKNRNPLGQSFATNGSWVLFVNKNSETLCVSYKESMGGCLEASQIIGK